MRPLRILARLLLLHAVVFAGHPLCAQAGANQTYATTPDGVRIAIQEWGTPRGHALVLVHGLLGSHLSWAKQLSDPRLLKYRIFTYDLRGHGMSGAPTDPASYSNRKLWADELKMVIEVKHLDHPVIVGWSLGGLVISDYLRLYGDGKLGGLVYVDGVIENKSEYLFPKPGVVSLLTSDDLAEHLEGTRQFVALCFQNQPDMGTFSTLFAAAAMASPLMTKTLFTQGTTLAHPAKFPKIHISANEARASARSGLHQLGWPPMPKK
jgi:pimeloyl-ACP methyl ester carboxylesterase